MKVLDRKNYELQSAPEGKTPEAEAKIERDLAAVKQERKELLALRKSIQVRLDFIDKPTANELVQTLMQLGQVKGPRQTDSQIGSAQGDVIRSNKNALRQQAHLLDKRDELIYTQRQVRQALERGTFNGLPPAELKQMRDLAALSIDKKLGQVGDLKEMVRQTDQQLKAMGVGGLFDGIQTTPEERARAEEEKRRADQEAWDNGYRS